MPHAPCACTDLQDPPAPRPSDYCEGKIQKHPAAAAAVFRLDYDQVAG